MWVYVYNMCIICVQYVYSVYSMCTVCVEYSMCVCFCVLYAVLPNFEIKIDVPKIVLQDEPFSGTVHAQ